MLLRDNKRCGDPLGLDFRAGACSWEKVPGRAGGADKVLTPGLAYPGHASLSINYDQSNLSLSNSWLEAGPERQDG